MPGWQQFYEKHLDEGFEIVSVAVDVQGAEKVKPWVDKAEASFTTLVDRQAVLGARFSLNYVPFSILIDEQGRIVREPRLINVANDAHRAQIASWIETGKIARTVPKKPQRSPASAFADAEAELRFGRAALYLHRGQTREAVADLKRALDRDPDNWLIRKQIWAIVHPDRFYVGSVDFQWQREQLARERPVDDAGRR